MGFVSDTIDTRRIEGKSATYAYREFGVANSNPPLVLLTRLSKVILISSGPLLIELALHDPRGLQRLQPRSEDVARGACIERDVVEAMLAEDDLAKGEQRPFFADHFQGGINGTDSGVGNAWGSHRTSNIGSLVDLQFKPIDVALAT